MNLRSNGSCNEIRGKLKHKYGQLTDDDLGLIERTEDELLVRLQQKLGKSKEELRSELALSSKITNGGANVQPEIKSVNTARRNRRRTRREIQIRILIWIGGLVPVLLLIFLWRSCS
jgi:uncharacterized protein YjbJ (UPF0337 family)